MKKSFLTLNLLILFTAAVFSQNVHQEWIGYYNSNGSPGIFIKTDAAGNAYVCGKCRPHDAPDYTFFQKFSPTGTQLFSTTIDTPCYMVSAFKDASDNIYIDGNNGLWAPPKSTLIKYNSSGIKQWRITESISANDGLGLMTGDNNGNPCVLRTLNGINQIVKYNSSGSQQLVFDITDTIGTQSFIVDNQNNFIITGYGYPYGTMTTIKYSSAGVKLWKTAYTFIPGNGSGVKMASASSGNIYIAGGVSRQSNTTDYCVIKYSSSGQQQWIVFYDRFQFDNAADMALDNMENTYVAGGSGTVKYSSSGTLLWADTTLGAAAITLDKYYNVYETGSAGNPSMMKTFKISSTGNFLWSINYATGAPFSDWADAIALDTSGNVFITGQAGYTPMPGYQGGPTTIKYSQLDGIINTGNSIPSSYNLYQNYPNPFNPSTKIKFSLPISSFSSIVIYDALGRQLETIVNEQLNAGTYEAEWSAGKFSSGIYFYKLTAGEFSETMKMVLIK